MRRGIAIAILAVEALAGAGALKAATTPLMPCCVSQSVLPANWPTPCCCCLLVAGLPAPEATTAIKAVQPVLSFVHGPLAAIPTKIIELAALRLKLFTPAYSPPDLFLLDLALRF